MTSATARLRLHDLLAQHARSRPDALAIGDGDLSLTWSAFGERVARCARALQRSGVRRGDRVLWLGQNSFRVQELLLGCSRLGAMLCPANWRMSADELVFVVDDLAPAIVFTQAAEVGDAVDDALASATHHAGVSIAHDVDDGYERWLAAAPPDDTLHGPATGEDPLLLIGTAAFEGRPNFAMLPHRAIIAQALVMGPLMGVSDASRYLNAGPLFHVGVFMENFATFVAGGANIFVRRVDGDDLCRAIAGFACTSGYIVGPMVDAIVAANSNGHYDLSTMHGRRGHPDYDRWVQPDTSAWGRRPGGYGQTETMGMQTFNSRHPTQSVRTDGSRRSSRSASSTRTTTKSRSARPARSPCAARP
jgi:long-chain acyl-CoA synthetase